MGLGYEYFIQIKTVIADSHYIYIFFFFSNLFIFILLLFFFVYGCMGCFSFWFPQHFDDEQCLYVAHNLKKENPFCKSLRKKKYRKRKTITRITVSFFFSILIYLFICSVEPNYFIFP